MSSERDESAELLEELSVKSDAEKDSSSPEKKFQEPGEHAKPKKKGRRGKKRKQRKGSSGAASENIEDQENRAESPPWDSDEDLDCEISSYNDVIIRPIDVPKAPENSTQFIIDDHNECRLYMSFETPNPYLSNHQQGDDKEGMIIEPIGEDAAYRDIDFEYDPPQDFDNSAYYDREFELSYKSNRFEELLRLSRTDLISGLRDLEARLKELSDDLVKVNPSPILEQLQAQLLELQEKHFELKECHSSLTALVAQSEVGSATDTSMEDSRANPLPSKIHKEPSLEDPSIPKVDAEVKVQDMGQEQGSCEKARFLQDISTTTPTSSCDHAAIEEESSSKATDEILSTDNESETSNKVTENASNIQDRLAVKSDISCSMDSSSATTESKDMEERNKDNLTSPKRTEENKSNLMVDSSMDISFAQSKGNDRTQLLELQEKHFELKECHSSRDNRGSEDVPHSTVQERCELSGVVQV